MLLLVINALVTLHHLGTFSLRAKPLFFYLSRCRDKFPKEKIPTLEEVVELCSSLELKMIIELKKGTQALEVSTEGRVFFKAHRDKRLFEVSFFFANLYLPRK